MKLTAFGQEVRRLRLEKEILMQPMATHLETTECHLSAVEFGKKPVPYDWPKKIAAFLKLPVKHANLLEALATRRTILVTSEVTACSNCPHVTNSARLHNDPFTSTPYPIRWYCMKQPDGRSIQDPEVIDIYCPFL